MLKWKRGVLSAGGLFVESVPVLVPPPGVVPPSTGSLEDRPVVRFILPPPTFPKSVPGLGPEATSCAPATEAVESRVSVKKQTARLPSAQLHNDTACTDTSA